jgi:hypothetical protein
MRRFRQHFRALLYNAAEALKDFTMEELKTNDPYTLAPWDKRVQTIINQVTPDEV